MKKKPTHSQLKQKLDAVFSLYIRRKYARGDTVKCFTCFTEKPVKEMQCGHFIPRSHLSTRWLEENCHPQCVGCNVFMKGRMDVYAYQLTVKYGPDILKKLLALKHTIRKFSPQELQEMIDRYKNLTS